jgi:hypothetical protein
MTQSTRPLRRALTAITIAALAVAIGAVFGAAGSGQAATQTAPTEKNPPTISGTPQQGQTLTADHGDWNGSQPLTYDTMAALPRPARLRRRQQCERLATCPDIGHTVLCLYREEKTSTPTRRLRRTSSPSNRAAAAHRLRRYRADQHRN